MVRITSVKPPVYAGIDTAAFAMLFRSDADAVIVDARRPEVDHGERIPGAVHLHEKTPEDDVRSALGSEKALIVTYCSNIHCPMSSAMAQRLREMGYENVLVYHDGLDGWQAAGYPVEGAKD